MATPREWLIEFLMELETALPSKPGEHHSLGVRRYGFENEIGRRELTVVLSPSAGGHHLFLDEADFDLSPQTLALECKRVLTVPDKG